MVQAEVRLCEAGVPGAADRPRGAAHRRSGSDRGASGQDLRYLPAHRSPREDGQAAGRHCRYRRKEPGETRPVAVAADPDRGHGHQSDQARRRRDRLRRHLRRARPAQSRRRGRHLSAISTRKPGPSCGRCRATIRFSPMRCGARAWCWANPGFPDDPLRTRQDAAGDGARDAGRRPAALHVQISGPAAQHAGAGKGRRPAAACSRSIPSATASCGGCR